MKKNILVTGAAGFIGMHLVIQLIKEGYHVFGIDNLNNYYDPVLKTNRLVELGINMGTDNAIINSNKYEDFKFLKLDILEKESLSEFCKIYQFDFVIHLAAQAGVRYSLSNPEAYMQSNAMGFFNILEVCKTYCVKHLIFASSSSIYGLNKKIPFSTDDKTDQPISLYAATKKSNELMAYTYSHLYKMPVTGLRFFTVYGPWYRPDMAMFLFADAIFSNKPIKIFNQGKMKRDFTFVDDIVTAVAKLVENVPGKSNTETSVQNPYYRVLNVGNHAPVNLLDMIQLLEEKLGRQTTKEFLPMQPGDVPVTFADVEPLYRLTGFSPNTSLEEGISKFAEWYKSYYKRT